MFYVLIYRIGVYVPTGITAFPNELTHTPRSWAKKKYKNIVTYSYMPRGGHFAAFEEPELLAQDIRQFVRKVEHLWIKGMPWASQKCKREYEA